MYVHMQQLSPGTAKCGLPTDPYLLCLASVHRQYDACYMQVKAYLVLAWRG